MRGFFFAWYPVKTLMWFTRVAIFATRARKWRNLVDALDLGSSGAIRGGSSPPFRIDDYLSMERLRVAFRSATHLTGSERRVDEEGQEPDPGFLEETQGRAPARGARRDEAGTAERTESAGALRKTTCDVDKIGTSRILTVSAGRYRPAPGNASDFGFDVDAGFSEIRQKMVGLAFFIESLLKDLRLLLVTKLARVGTDRSVTRHFIVLDVLRG